MKRKDFYTRPESDKGVKFHLVGPDGTQSDEWLLVAGAESLRYEKTHRDTVKAIIAGSDSLEQGNILLAALIIDWSFEDECTSEIVLDFLQNAPYIKVDLDRFVVNRANFLKKK